MNETSTVDESVKKKGELMSWLKTIIISIIIVGILRIFVFEFVYVERFSMHPTISDSDKLCVLKINYTFSSPKREDIAIVKISEDKKYVKRVIGLPGETIEVKNNIVYIDDMPIEENYLPPHITYSDFEKITIPEGKYFVMGDNRVSSIDSRDPDIGLISEENFIGKVIFRLSPFTWF